MTRRVTQLDAAHLRVAIMQLRTARDRELAQIGDRRRVRARRRVSLGVEFRRRRHSSGARAQGGGVRFVLLSPPPPPLLALFCTPPFEAHEISARIFVWQQPSLANDDRVCGNE